MNDEEVSLSLPVVELEECDGDFNTIQIDTFIAQGTYEIVGNEGPNLLLRTRRSKTLKIHANRAKLFFA